MKDYQKRMIAEFKELGEKRARLDQFMESEKFKGLPFVEMRDMQYQLAAMKEYEKAMFARLQRVGMNFDAFKHDDNESTEVESEKKESIPDSPARQGNESVPTNETDDEYVDLGLPSGTLWAKENAEGFYTFDDAVAAFGNKLPSAVQMAELYECCAWSWDGGRKGFEVTGQNGNSIFLPAAGYRHRGSSGVSGVVLEGNYWTRCSDKFSAARGRCLYFSSGNVYPLNSDGRAYGFSVRAVRESN